MFPKLPDNSEYDMEQLNLSGYSITNPTQSPGVILGNEGSPMTNVVFDNVRAVNSWSYPWFGDYYKCEGMANATAVAAQTQFHLASSTLINFDQNHFSS